jgi:hypothetical protein
MSIPLFALGQIVTTPGAREALKKAKQLPQELLNRHVAGDWGEVSCDDAEENQLSLAHGYNVLSSYTTAAGDKILVVTEADRSVTTLLLPQEY